jgi:hypothetical protein
MLSKLVGFIFEVNIDPYLIGMTEEQIEEFANAVYRIPEIRYIEMTPLGNHRLDIRAYYYDLQGEAQGLMSIEDTSSWLWESLSSIRETILPSQSPDPLSVAQE